MGLPGYDNRLNNNGNPGLQDNEDECEGSPEESGAELEDQGEMRCGY